MKTATATYTNREGQRLELVDLQPHTHLPGFYWATWVRPSGGPAQRICVHTHRLRFHEPLDPAAPSQPLPTGNPS